MKICVNHLGFMPDDPCKQAVIFGNEQIKSFKIINLNQSGYNEIGPNGKMNQYVYSGELQKKQSDKGMYYIADFSEIKEEGIYIITLEDKYNSVPFQIRADVYKRTLRKAFDYIHIQRCGQAVEGYHKACHLDDARTRATEEHIDMVGGWHDAGDLRKWMAHSMLLAVGILQLKQHQSPKWYNFNEEEDDLLAELRWGLQYFHKMIDKSGRIFNDVGAGLNGDNSDNHWTDNVISADDRYINTAYQPEIQWEFIYVNAMAASAFWNTDEVFAKKCLILAEKALNFIETNPEYRSKINTWVLCDAQVEFEAWSLLAYKAMYDCTKEEKYLQSLKQGLKSILLFQETEYRYEQTEIRGYWYKNQDRKTIFKDLRDSGIILIALCEAYSMLEADSCLKKECVQAIRMYCQDYIEPLVERNAYGIIPFGVFAEDVTDETYHSIGGNLKYRMFSPTQVPFYQGLTSHLLSHAVGLEMAGQMLAQEKWKQIAKHQMEWVMGRNPDRACLMTGEGINNPYPHSRFLGLIPGGIMNGYIGGIDDEPYLDMGYQMDWRTTEYWSPHTCFYLWYISLL